ncbi:MAG TPA: hypothetical protein VEA63_11750, partial [Opitutus sp.]|nr:hypothetical protein [Opitutus sp.]
MSTVALLRRAPPFEIEFNRASTAFCAVGEQPALHLPIPWLGGSAVERVFAGAEPAGENRGFALSDSGGLLIGCAVQPVGSSIQCATRELYRRLFDVVRPRTLYRIWNYVPAINAVANGVENYRAFCAGRAEVFEATHGAEFKRHLPAASAVGCGGDALALVF